MGSSTRKPWEDRERCERCDHGRQAAMEGRTLCPPCVSEVRAAIRQYDPDDDDADDPPAEVTEYADCLR